ncbi:MAG: isoprenylcysteine carboxylmethyltransferase family protein [Steroidobacteraceae bacterium]|jgi:protein-S-isoprenylcysteine O-methyltransferase Ste14|nr:isoprenylcysteine carboxylmethyltransferase family protein [Steroidobacteraceae bacterium]
MAGLELKVPPPLVGLACALVMKGIALGGTEALAPGPADALSVGWPLLRVVAVALVLAGLAIDVVGVLSFRRARTTINPLKPANSSALVTSGIYGLTRNPMYLGMATLLLGWAAWLGTPWALAGVALFVAWITRFQIVPEERVLARLFGADFEAYRARVRRWI